MKENSYITEFMIASERVCTLGLGSPISTEKSPVRGYSYFYEHANKICACRGYRVYLREEIVEQNVAWILQTSTVDGGVFVANIITEDSIHPKNSNLN